jgi:hypothetical protein
MRDAGLENYSFPLETLIFKTFLRLLFRYKGSFFGPPVDHSLREPKVFSASGQRNSREGTEPHPFPQSFDMHSDVLRCDLFSGKRTSKI